MAAISFAELTKWLGDLEPRLVSAGRRGVVSAAFRGVNEITTSIIPSRVPQPVDRGTYRAGWKAFANEDGATIENNEPHAVFVEEGVRAENVKPGRKMIDALAEWVERKGIAPKAEARSVAFAISKSMQKKGIFRGGKGMGILRQLMAERMPTLLREEIDYEISKELSK